MKCKWLALLLAALMTLTALPLAAFAETEATKLLEGDTAVYTKTLNADGSTYTVTFSDPTGDGKIPNLASGSAYLSLPWNDKSHPDVGKFTKFVFDETIREIGTYAIVLINQSTTPEIYIQGRGVVVQNNGITDFSNGGKKATVHAYSDVTCTLKADKFAGLSYYEAEAFEEKYVALWTLETADAESQKESILAAIAEYDTLPSAAQTQLVGRKLQLDNLNAALNGEAPSTGNLLFPDDTITVEKLLNTDGVTYTVIISDPTGDGVLPARVTDERRNLPWHDDTVTVIIFDETITKIVTTTVELLNKHIVKEIHFKAPEVATPANSVVDYSNDPGRQATVYAYSTWNYALSAKFAGIVYYEAKNFIDTYADLWTLTATDATFYEEEIAAAVAAYPQIPETARTQLSTQKAKLDELADAIGLELPETNEKLLFENDTVLFEKTLNEDGKTYTVTVSDPLGDGVLPNISNIASSMPWHAADVTAVIFDETIVGLSAQTVYITNSCALKDIYLLAPYVSTPANALVDYSNDGKKATVHAYGTFTYALSEKFAGVSYFEAENFTKEHEAVFALDESAAAANRTAIAKAIADYMILPAAVQNTLATKKQTLDTLGAALGLSGSENGVSYLIDDINHVLQITGSGAISTFAAWDSFKDSITSILVGDGITEIKAGAFSGFTALEKVDLPFTIETIESGAFPASAFEMHGWLNHPIGDYAALNSNVSLKLKELRILSLGNSHTLNYTSFFADIIKDLKAGLDTAITHQRIVTGSRRMYDRDSSATTGNHYDAAHNLDNISGVDYPDSTDHNRYVEAFAKTWDIVIIQDYRESTKYGAAFAEGIPTVMEWLHDDAEGAKIIWFADWVENVNTSAFSYQNSLAAIEAVEALPEGDKPDYIVVVSTIIENARNTYFGTSMNPAGVCASKNGTEKLPILESDGAHMSYELGQYMLGNAVMYQILEEYRELLPVDDSFDYFALQVTDPVNAEWIGEFVPEYRDVIKEICVNSYKNRFAETASEYTVDPAIAKHEALYDILAEVAVPKAADATALNILYKSDAVVEAINALGFAVKAGDITVTYDEAAGTYTVFVKCQYGYTVSEGVTYTASVSTAADKSVAKIGSTSFASLADAMAAAENGDTITLLDHAVITESLAIDGKSITVDLNGYEVAATTAVFALTNGASLTLKGGSITTYGSKSYAVSSNEADRITLTDTTLTAYDSRVIYHTAEAGSVTITIKDSTLTAKNSVAVLLADKQTEGTSLNTLVIENSTLTGTSAVDAKRTNVTVKGSSALTATMNVAMLTGFKKTGATGYAIALSNNENATVGSVTVTGGSFIGTIGIEPAYEGFTNEIAVAISGGRFDKPVPAEFCAEGYTPKDYGNGTFGVYSESAPTPPSTLDASIISHQVSKGENGLFSLRAIAGINSLNYKNFGYEVTITTAGGTKTLTGTSTVAYTSIRSGETLYSIQEHFGFEYGCFATVTGLSLDSPSTEIVIRAYVTTSDGEKLYGDGVTLLYTGTQDSNGFPVISIVE